MADWSGEFGDKYTIRNAELADRTEFFKKFAKYGVEDAFEIGCNIGTNLKILESLGVEAMGCDVNACAVEAAILNGLKVYVGDGTNIYMPNDFEFVFTVGVLIHQQTPELITVMKNMVVLSSWLVMFAEYKGTDEEVPYRGERFALFKRDYGRIFEAIFPNAELLEDGTAGKELGFDNVTYWVYDVSNCSSEVRFDTPPRKSSEECERPDVALPLVGKTKQVCPAG